MANVPTTGRVTQVLGPVVDQFWGERSGKFEDPFGHIWFIQTRTEEVSPQEMQRRYDDLMKQGG